SILPLLDGGPFHRERPLYWQFNHAHTPQALALRQGDWKILARLTELPARNSSITAESNRILKTAEPTAFELYDLAADIGETTALAGREPERLRAMVGLLTARFHEIRDETPTWPLFDDPGYERDRIKWPDYVAKPLPRPASPPR